MVGLISGFLMGKCVIHKIPTIYRILCKRVRPRLVQPALAINAHGISCHKIVNATILALSHLKRHSLHHGGRRWPNKLNRYILRDYTVREEANSNSNAYRGVAIKCPDIQMYVRRHCSS